MTFDSRPTAQVHSEDGFAVEAPAAKRERQFLKKDFRIRQSGIQIVFGTTFFAVLESIQSHTWRKVSKGPARALALLHDGKIAAPVGQQKIADEVGRHYDVVNEYVQAFKLLGIVEVERAKRSAGAFVLGDRVKDASGKVQEVSYFDTWLNKLWDFQIKAAGSEEALLKMPMDKRARLAREYVTNEKSEETTLRGKGARGIIEALRRRGKQDHVVSDLPAPPPLPTTFDPTKPQDMKRATLKLSHTWLTQFGNKYGASRKHLHTWERVAIERWLEDEKDPWLLEDAFLYTIDRWSEITAQRRKRGLSVDKFPSLRWVFWNKYSNLFDYVKRERGNGRYKALRKE